MKILITGGAGFVGSSLAKQFRSEFPQSKIVALDNLKRRGSENNITLFKSLGIDFVHGDIRNREDLNALKDNFDLFIEASAEPSVLAGLDGDPGYLIQTNLVGTLNCLEFARARAKHFIFLSTSRVYSIEPLKELKFEETSNRFELAANQLIAGVSEKGISEAFPTHQFRSLYGATKLASELLIQEYAQAYDMNALINRCGVLCGPGQFGKVDQGVFTLWVANHYFGKPLRYTGFGGEGKQVRDLLHPDDLFQLILEQNEKIESHRGGVFNVGGGREVSVSMKEMTALCETVTGRRIDIASDPKTSPVDIPLYLSDTSYVTSCFNWHPKKTPLEIVKEIHFWLRENEALLKPLFA